MLDNVDYSEKLIPIIQNNNIPSITIMRMEIPCCGGLELTDRNLCIRCELCCAICDEIFRINDQGTAEAYQPVNNENRDTLQEAMNSCPVSAIDLD